MEYHYFVSAAVHNIDNGTIAYFNCEYIANEKINSMNQVYEMAESIRKYHISHYAYDVYVAIINYKLLRQKQE